ncbi:glycyl-radical enzyme activating protein [Natronincola ferrireducens]|uniref:Pyruvate formate lyase activating enzyme n=1 Tax=Natronincola ferrireducens TaxID=393762 RepID=A0A1G8YG27_9FIRM|nr:glycyl-radical enzyme activating protein [Natronincola ferrireducens]SDK01354.1 pyruvate formate lyase activating enzyme [Natronincola ferrireducens]
MQKGIVFNIQKYSLHDGPGIRTTVFLKGCPLNCWWCHNPESKNLGKQLIFVKSRCIGCGLCSNRCHNSAIDLIKESNNIDRQKCENCGMCAEACPTNAMELIGKEMTIEEVMKEIEKDRVFYEESKGGVTFSGGEPLVQWEFLYELLKKCKQQGISTAVDTSGFTSWNILEKISKLTDLFLYDLKHMKEEEHQRFTGVSNMTILNNLNKLALIHPNIHIRIPIIPGINNDEENIGATGKFISSLGLNRVSILPYHHVGMDKYNRIEEIYKIPEILEPSDEEMQGIAKVLKTFKLNVMIGG